MKTVAWLITACIGLAVLRTALLVLMIVAATILLWAAVRKPKEACSLLLTLAICNVIATNPTTALTIAGMLTIASYILPRRL
jgi:Na+-transporting methylmalonyl-CoA/oxaloacetate decarboxylase beta subunit